MECNACQPKEWAMLPIRFTLGLLFLALGLQLLASLISGWNEGFIPWVVSIILVLGGLFLLIGLMMWWSCLLLSVVVVIGAIAYTFESGFSIIEFTYYLVVFGGLLTVMHGGRFLTVHTSCCKHKEEAKQEPQASFIAETKLEENAPETPTVTAAPVATKKAKKAKAKPKKAKKKK